MTYDAASAAPGPFTSVQVVTPINGQNVVVSNGRNVLLINNTGLISNMTITLPASPRDGQIFTVGARSIITALTMSSSAAIYGGLSGMGAFSFARYVYSADVPGWFRIG